MGEVALLLGLDVVVDGFQLVQGLAVLLVSDFQLDLFDEVARSLQMG